MALKRATYYTYGSDTLCVETKKYIEEAGIILDIRDLEKEPFTVDEVKKLIGFLDPKHFINPSGKTYKQHHLDTAMPPREELVVILAEDPTLIRRPIIRTPRLMTVGCDKRKISEMLQMTFNNGDTPIDESKGNVIRPNNHRRDDHSRKKESYSGK